MDLDYPSAPIRFLLFLGEEEGIVASETIQVASNIAGHQYILIILEIYFSKSCFPQVSSLVL